MLISRKEEEEKSIIDSKVNEEAAVAKFVKDEMVRFSNDNDYMNYWNNHNNDNDNDNDKLITITIVIIIINNSDNNDIDNNNN